MGQDVTSLIIRVESLEAQVADSRLSKLSRTGDDTEKKISHLSTAAKALGVALAGIGFVGIISNAARAGKEIDIFSKQLKISTEAMSEWGFAAKSVGFDTEKMADIFKDVSEKIGDAFLNNAGEAKEALDLLGIPLRDIVNLSPDKQLLKIGDALDKIQSQSGKIQVMEALANDASRLIPLLDNNSQQVKELTEKFRDMGGTLTELEAEKLKKANQAMSDIQTTISILGQTISIKLSDQIVAFSDFVTTYFNPAIDGLVKGFRLAATVIAGSAATIGLAITGNFDAARVAINLMKADLESIWNNIPTDGPAPVTITPSKDQLEEDAALMQQHQDQMLYEIRENERQIAAVKKQYRDKEKAEQLQRNQFALNQGASFFGSLASLESGNSKASFERQKKWLYAETVLSTIASAQAAFYSAVKIPGVGIGAGIAAAAVATAAGIARAAQISRTTYNASASPTIAGGGGVSASPAALNPPESQISQPTPVQPIIIQIGGRTVAEVVAEGLLIGQDNDVFNFQTENTSERVIVG